MKKSIFALIALFSSVSASAAAVGNSELALKIYSISVSTSALCTSPTTIQSNANPDYQDLVANPTLFSGDVASGVYPCIILEVSDHWKIKPTASNAVCTSGTEYTYDICQPGISTDKLDGSTVNCTAGEDHIFIYMSTAATGNPDTILGVFQKPTVDGDNQHGYNMAAAFQVSGSLTSTLTIANVLTNALDNQSGVCGLAASPHFQFQ